VCPIFLLRAQTVCGVAPQKWLHIIKASMICHKIIGVYEVTLCIMARRDAPMNKEKRLSFDGRDRYVER